MMKRIAAPMASSTLLELQVLPVMYILWRESGLMRQIEQRTMKGQEVLK